MNRKQCGLRAVMPLLIISLVLIGCAPGSSPSPAARPAGGAPQGAGPVARQGTGRFGPIPVLTVMVKVGPLTAGNETAATVAPYRQSTVAAQVAGVVLHIVHLAGDWVKEGEPVVVLDTSQLRLAVAGAQSLLDGHRRGHSPGGTRLERL